MIDTKHYTIKPDDSREFRNNVTYCVGTGRMGLALQREYYEQLKMVQEHIGFRYIRGHGLFHEDMSIYQEYKDADGNIIPEYNFTYLDMVMDMYIELGLRPFIELGFMPKKIASADNTIFYWQGNTTPPKDYTVWTDLVQGTLRHLMERYGGDEVVTWPVEVWNEPNLGGFWKDADMPEYFKLYDKTARAVKEVDARFRVGGPAICGVDDVRWMKEFLQFCKNSNSPLDFVTRHHYTIQQPKNEGHYNYAKLNDFDEDFALLRTSRDIIDSFDEYKGYEMHITEFNTSYSPRTTLHDTNCNAAYVARLLSEMGDVNESYSYWTFGDIFEESGVPFTPFHGGFGLVANGRIPKPTFWIFHFFSKLIGQCVHRSKEAVVTKTGGQYRGIAWNSTVTRAGTQSKIEFDFPAIHDGKEYCIIEKRVDERYCNPLKIWHDLGEPANPSAEQLSIIKEGAKPLVTSSRIQADKGRIGYNVLLDENAVVYFEIHEVTGKSDRGYDYERVMAQESE